VTALLALALCTQPWSRCSPDAFWLRRVLAYAGFRDVGQTGSALMIPNRRRQWRFIWATPGTRVDPVYKLTARVDGRAVYSDRVRVTWIVQKRHVWVGPPPTRRLLVRLVRASASVRR
jgi:hypothetical protein